MTTGVIHGEKHREKQMGCMAGFFQLFDRHHILAGKRLYSTTKRLTSPPSPVTDSPPEPEKPKQTKATASAPACPTPATKVPASATKTPISTTTVLPIMEVKEGTRSAWKFGREAPRLSLDSRATVDNKGKLCPKIVRAEIDGGDEKRRSTSVIARLMGLEPLSTTPEVAKMAELRRSASESRVSKDLSRFMNVDKSFDNTTYLPTKTDKVKIEKNDPTVRSYSSRPWKSPHQQRKNYFDSEDFFPEPKQSPSIYNEIERRLRMRGIDEPCKDLETLKQILEAMQLKGLLHNKRPNSDRRNYVYAEESQIVLMKPGRSRTPPLRSGVRRGGERDSPRRERPRNVSSPTKREIGKNSPNCSPVRRRVVSGVETQRRMNEVSEQRRASPVHSPRMSPRRIASDLTVGNNRSPRNRRLVIDTKERITDESSSITESTVSTSSQTDTERSKMEEYKGGRSLLERCDKLLNSIAEMTAAELQPSPVSVLDSSFYKDDSSSPSPIMKRSIDFKDRGEYEEDVWSPMFSPVKSQSGDTTIQDCDYVYISDIVRACNYLPDNSDMFLLLEKQQYLKGKDTSKASKLQRKLIFDTINEILDRNRQLPPWKLPIRPNSGDEKPSLSHIWSEFQRIRERDLAEEDLFDTICSVLRKDLAGDQVNGWGDCHMEKSEAVLDIERLIFKDIVGEAIQDLVTIGGPLLQFRESSFIPGSVLNLIVVNKTSSIFEKSVTSKKSKPLLTIYKDPRITNTQTSYSDNSENQIVSSALGKTKLCDKNSALIRVYMYDLPNEFHFGLLGWKGKGGRLWPDINNPSQIPPYPGGLNLQHSIEYWLTLDLLSSNGPDLDRPCSAIRVYNSSQADIIFVPFFSSLSYNRFSKLRGNEKVSLNGVLQNSLLTFLKNRDEWKRLGGKNHLIIAHHPNSMLIARKKLGPAMFILADFGRYPKEIANLQKDVIAPYKHLVKIIPANKSSKFEERPILVYFQGAIYRKDGGVIRQELYYLLKDEKDVHFTFGNIKSNGVSQAGRGMSSSKFCLNIAGDTPSSNRLFDAIASHCVPVIISDGIELPYEDILDYSEFCVFVRSSNAVKKGFLLNLLRGINKEQWTKMWERLKKVERHFEYQYPSRPGDAVDMMWQAVSRKVSSIQSRAHRNNRYRRSQRLVNTS